MTKKAGIVCDNYKLSKFKQELAAAGFSDVSHQPYSINKERLTLITVIYNSKRTPELNEIIINVEKYFKASKN